jgi:hypothetical protein
MRPESEQSTIDIAEIEKSFPTPPKSNRGDRKTLPPLPPLAEIEKEAAGVAVVENVFKVLSPAGGGPEKELPLSFGISTAEPLEPLSKDESRPMTASTKRLSFTSIDPKRKLKYGTGKYAMVELSPQPSDDPNDPLVWTPCCLLVVVLDRVLISNSELAIMEEEPQLRCAVIHGGHRWRYENRARQCSQRPRATGGRFLHGCSRSNGGTIDDIGLGRDDEHDISKSLGQAAGLPSVYNTGIYWLCVEH